MFIGGKIIFHSDRGSQYATGDYQRQLKAYGMLGSMSRKGNCWDNSVTETLFGSLKVERLHGMRFSTRRAGKGRGDGLLIGLSLIALFGVVPTPAFAEPWLPYFAEDSEGQKCFVYTRPTEATSAPKVRRNTTAMVSFSSLSPLESEFSTVLGFAPQTPVRGELVFPGVRFTMGFAGGAGWTKGKRNDPAVLEAFRNNSHFSVVFVVNGKEFTDRYDAAGFADALKALSEKCRFAA